MTYDSAFNLLGHTQENLTQLSHLAADLDDTEMSRAIAEAQLAVLRAGNRIVALRNAEAAA